MWESRLGRGGHTACLFARERLLDQTRQTVPYAAVMRTLRRHAVLFDKGF